MWDARTAEFIISQVGFELGAQLQRQNTKERIVSSILGAGYLGQRARQRVADAKARLAKAGEKFDVAIGQAESAATDLEVVASGIEKEAAELTATAAQLTNGPPADDPTEPQS